MKESTKFLKKVYAAADKDNKDECIDIIFNYINDLLMQDAENYTESEWFKYDEIDEILERVDILKLPTFALLAFLTITAASKQYLAYRETFYYKLYDVLPYKLLKGLE